MDPIASISFQDVGYTYPWQARPAVEGVSFTVRKGEKVAFVGATGAGKSTLAYLLMRFASVGAGQILVNGIPLNTFPLDEWRHKIAWVPQKPVLFQGSLAENIALGKPEASRDDIFAASRLAHLDDFVRRLPKGYDTELGEFGARLSGGEMQRVALARAFLLDAPILIFDEPTAHLDPQSEAWLEESMQRLGTGRTQFIIAHRLPTVYSADQILVLEGGRIVERGNHTELKAAGGRYFRYVQLYGGAAA